MALQAPKRIPRDCLTGAPLRAGLPIYLMSVPMKQQRPRYLEATGDTVSAPLTLHRNVTDEGGLGGLIYAAMMAKYLGLAVAEQQSAQARAEHLEMIAWWRSAYGVRRVTEGLLQRLPAKAAQHVLEVVMTCHREQADPLAIAERFGHSEQWVLGKIDWCMKLANRR